MTDPAYAFAIGDYVPIVADPASDSDAKPQQGSISATVTLTPILQSGDVILATGASPRPKGFIPVPIVGRIDTDGIVKLRVDPDEGSTHGYPYQPIMILCDTPLLELDGPLFYRVTFSNVIFGGKPGKINSFEFQAPTVDGAVVNLITVGRVPGQPAPGITRGPVGASGATGATGATGASGLVGATGATGASGASGASGGTGGAGASGATGATGATGVSDVAVVTHAASGKATPVDADELPLVDSAGSWGLKKLTWANLKTALLSYISTAVASFTNKTLVSPTITNPTITGTNFVQRAVSAPTGPVMLGSAQATDYVTLPRLDEAVALLHLDGASGSTTIVDSGRLAANWTVAGSAQISTAQSVSGGASLYLDGTGDYIYPTAAESNFAFGTNDFTIEMWIRPTVIAGAARQLIDFRPATTQGDHIGIYILNSDASIRYFVNSVNRIIGQVLSVDTWYHIAVTRASGTTRMFVDGVQTGSSWTDTTNYLCPAARPVIGAATYNIGDSSKFIGFMDGVRILNGHAAYTSTFTPPVRHGDRFEDSSTAAGTVALLHCDGASGSTAIADSGVLQSNWTRSGDVAVSTAQSKFSGTSLYFDGTGDYIVPSADATNFAFASDFTIEMWVRPTVLTGATRFLYDARPTSTQGAYGTLQITAGGVLEWYANTAVRITGGSLSVDTWYHVAVSRESGTTRLYLDGTQIGSSYTDATSYLSSASRPRIGSNGAADDSNKFIGYMDDIRISKGIARYTTTFTPPATPHPDPPSLRLPGASGSTNHHTVYNDGTETILLTPYPGQSIDGVTAPLELATNQKWCGVPIPAGTGWHKVT